MNKIKDAISRHERIALQFSGGKDSLAVLDVLRPYLDKITVYWCNPGDPLPEHAAFVRGIGSRLPNFVEIEGRLFETVSKYGIPSDIVPFSSSYAARAIGVIETHPINGRYDCCFDSLMAPLHERMLEDGTTLIIRGQKSSDRYKGHLRSGDTDTSGIEYLYPIETWNDQDVLDYLWQHGIELPDYYKAGIGNSIDCAVCTAWLSEGKGAYLKERHPDLYQTYQSNLLTIAHACKGVGDNLIKELEA
jgi:phosphoadenosine phosphosulfate reductase